MTDELHDNEYRFDPQKPDPDAALRRYVKVLIAVIVLGLAAFIAVYWMKNKPRADKRPRASGKPLVTVQPVAARRHVPMIRVMGKVSADEQVQLVARISGQIVSVNPELITGSRISAGESAAAIDPQDYKLAVRQAEAALKQARENARQSKLAIANSRNTLARAEMALKVEKGNQQVAKKEFDLMKKSSVTGKTAKYTQSETELILRKPHLKAAEAAYKAARSGVEMAKASHASALAAVQRAKTALDKTGLDLKRTEIIVPFDAVVVSKHIGTGSYVTPGIPVATLVSTDLFWVRAAIPVDQLKWITFASAGNEEGSTARIYHDTAWGPNTHRRGVVRKLAPGIEPAGRMAEIMIAVRDPFSAQETRSDMPVLMLGAYTRVIIEGNPIPDSYRISREFLREGKYVWVLTPKNTLDIREVGIAFSGPQHVIITSGLSGNDRLIITDIPTPVQGMELQNADAESREPKPGNTTPGKKNERESSE